MISGPLASPGLTWNERWTRLMFVLKHPWSHDLRWLRQSSEGLRRPSLFWATGETFKLPGSFSQRSHDCLRALNGRCFLLLHQWAASSVTDGMFSCVWAEFKGTWITLLPWEQQGFLWLVAADCVNLYFLKNPQRFQLFFQFGSFEDVWGFFCF